ncbi:MAG: prephenate dehydratase [Bacteroidetes bacterium MED-G13]|nr:MAG: prephenate dehydratase [Bacteroidetes bacterium MED-G13]|tara:strand:- start:23065 stop:23895 length:831 start_codon:yes stop_codon:yes gene_type:complete
MSKKNIGIQGIQGSFHHIVANEYYGSNIDIDEFLTFEMMSRHLAEGKSDASIMAIENSIAGSIIPNYALIDEYNLSIVGEYYLKISHNLLALENQSIDDIKEVHSHPMALLQCRDFFKKHPKIKLVEDTDTALSAKEIYISNVKGRAAIASELASNLYSLNVLAENIQTIKNNETRFVVLKRSIINSKSVFNKASIKFELDHKRGSLATILNVLSDCKINLTKIQSMPKIETPWRYSFFVDITFESLDDYFKAKSIIEIMAKDFKILGEYKNSKND